MPISLHVRQLTAAHLQHICVTYVVRCIKLKHHSNMFALCVNTGCNVLIRVNVSLLVQFVNHIEPPMLWEDLICLNDCSNCLGDGSDCFVDCSDCFRKCSY